MVGECACLVVVGVVCVRCVVVMVCVCMVVLGVSVYVVGCEEPGMC